VSRLIEKKVSRRRFLGLSSCALAAATVGSQVKVLRALAKTGDVGEVTTLPSKQVFTTCAMCVNLCGVIADVRNGVIHKLNPNPAYVKSRSMLCARGNSGLKVTYDPDRLKYPLIRVGERGAGKWRRASWEEALRHPGALSFPNHKSPGNQHSHYRSWSMTDRWQPLHCRRLYRYIRASQDSHQ
jgi:thiosulfate reductase/polysulfide reductase chain A